MNRSMITIAIYLCFFFSCAIGYSQNCGNANFAGHSKNDKTCEIDIFISKVPGNTVALYLSIDDIEVASLSCDGKDCEGIQTFRVSEKFCNTTRTLAVRVEKKNGQDCKNDLGEKTLPIELLYFRGEQDQHSNWIEWVTATEINNQWQILERSANGLTNWEEIARIEATGWSTETQYYNWEDENPLEETYYKLRAVDFDGAEQKSDVIVISRKGEKFEITNVYPNPAIDRIHLEYQSNKNGDVQLQILDALGRLTLQRPLSAVKGRNEQLIRLDDLSSGNYFLVLADGKEKSVRQFSVANGQ